MKHTFLSKAAELLRANSKRRRWYRMLTGMAAVVVFVTAYMLILPAITMETDTICGMAEHTHTDACYEYTLICDQEESPEVFEEQEVLVCGQTECEAHAHDDACYQTVRELTCTTPEGEGGHTHSDSCYDEEGNLICGMSEGEGGHEHTDACYVESQALVCGKEESAGHQHTADCYEIQKVVVSGHTHSDACYEKTLICDIPEHVHTDECYASDETVETKPELVCEIEEHTHSEDCYDADGNLTCELEEHTHSDACYAELEEIPEEDVPLGGIPDDVLMNDPDYTTEIEMEDGNVITVNVYDPEGSVPVGALLQAELLSEDSEAYAKAQEALTESDKVGEYSDMLALDIHFEMDGSEVEPEGKVYVDIQAQAVLPEGADPESVAVQHHVETTEDAFFGLVEETVTTVEIVADSTEETGTITLTPAESQDLAVDLLADVAAEEPTEETEQLAAMNIQAEFGVNSFSTFTITWYYGSDLAVHIVDQNGNDIDESIISGNDINGYYENYSSWQSIDNVLSDADLEQSYTTENGKYTYIGAYADSSLWTKVTYLKNRDDEWRYSQNSSKPSSNSRGERLRNLYLVYNAPAKELETVDTVDSTSKGVYTYMFNYSSPAFSSNIGGYGDGSTKQNLASNVTTVRSGDSLGFPYIKQLGQSNGSFRNWFNPDNGTAANHLYLKSVYDDTGYFYYSAFENFAEFDTDSGNFTVYNALGTPSSDTSQFYFQRGNFMPFNTLNPNEVRNHNLYNPEGQKLQPGDDRYNENLYGFNERTNDFYFGMYTYAEFYQPKDGLYNGQPMLFEFTGDDDMWVYIDGVLVLDLGGIHDAQSGFINFTDGSVGYTLSAKNGNLDWQYTDIAQQFTNAGKHNSVKWDPERTDTFADGTLHTIQIFYMERGAGASNLKIKFNLPTVPDGSLTVRKNVENYFNAQMEDISYQMQLLDANNTPMAGEPYTMMGGDGTVLYTDSEGKFWLQHDQTAVFNEIGGDETVKIKEVAIQPEDDNRLDDYDFSFTVTDSTGDEQTGSSESKEVSVTMPPAGSASVTVNNRATFTAPVKVTKAFTDNSTPADAPEGFDATFTVYEIVDEKPVEIGSVPYSDFKNGEYTFWLEEGKTYQIVETVNEAGTYGEHTYRTTTYTVDGGVAQAGTTAQFNLEQGSSVDNGIVVAFTNEYGPAVADLTIVKNIYGLSKDQVVKLINGDYRKINPETADESGLRFDVDFFAEKDHLISDEAGEDVPGGWQGKYWNVGDWTFDVSDTLDDNGFVGGTWNMEITEVGDSSIGVGDGSHYINASLKEMNDGSETWYQYTVTIQNVDISANNWYRVWEMHVDVPGYALSSSVAEMLTGQGDDTLGNLLTTDEVMAATNNRGDHSGRATAFQLNSDTTVVFTNRYQQGDLEITKEVLYNGETTNTGTQEFEFRVSIPAQWADPTQYNDGAYGVTYQRAAGTKHPDGTIQFAVDGDNAVATVKLYAGETATISLPVGITPAITEINYDGYAPSWKDTVVASDGTSDILANGGVTITTQAISVDNPIEVTCTNTTGAQLPSTGGIGITPFVMFGTMLTLGAGTLLLIQRRRREGSDA